MSLHWDILEACQSILSQAVAGLPSMAGLSKAVKIRKLPHYDRDRDGADAADALVCLSPQEEIPQVVSFDNEIWMGFPVLVTVFVSGRSLLTDEVAVRRLLDLRDTIRKRLHTTALVGVDAVRDCDYDANPVYDAGPPQRLLDVSKQKFTFKADTTRATL